MKYGIKLYSEVDNPEGVPGEWPAITVKFEDGDMKILPYLDGYTVMTESEYLAYIAEYQGVYDAWAAVNLKAGLVQDIRDRIDVKTDLMIAAGIVYEGKRFKLDVEHQNSYMFDYLLNQSYPHEIKGVGEDYLVFASRDEHTAFIGYGFGAVDAMIRGGWELKSGLDGKSYGELLVWEDPR